MDENMITMISGVALIIAGIVWLIKIRAHKSSCTSGIEATVVKIDREEQRDDKGEEVIYYSAVFGYEVEGKSYNVKESGKSSHSRYKPGDKVKLFYNPEDPNKFYIKGSVLNTIVAFALIAAGVALIIASF